MTFGLTKNDAAHSDDSDSEDSPRESPRIASPVVDRKSESILDAMVTEKEKEIVRSGTFDRALENGTAEPAADEEIAQDETKAPEKADAGPKTKRPSSK